MSTPAPNPNLPYSSTPPNSGTNPPPTPTPTGPLAKLTDYDSNVMENLSYPIQLQQQADYQFPHCLKISVFRPDKSQYITNDRVELSGKDSATRLEENLQFGNQFPNYDQKWVSDPKTAPGTIAAFLAAKAGLSLAQQGLQGKTNPVEFIANALAGGLFAVGAGSSIETFIGATLLKETNVKRSGKKLKQNIFLYVPDQVVVKHSHKYSDVSATAAYGDLGFLLQAGKAATAQGTPPSFLKDLLGTTVGGADKLLEAAKNQDEPIGKELANRTIGRLTEALGLTGEGLQQLQLQSIGFALNPQLEVLFDNTEFRTFQFQFSFLPRTKEEAEMVFKIIKNLRFFSAPEIVNGISRYFVPPYYFELEYRMRDENGDWQDNPYMPKISTCVLESIDVDYVGDSDRFLTFRDGRPVNVKLLLNFKEIEIIHKELIAQGY